MQVDWKSWIVPNRDQLLNLETRLRIEAGHAHPLHHSLPNLRVAARDEASDDILVLDPGNPAIGLVVHLTWSETAHIAAQSPHWAEIPRAIIPDVFL